MIFANVASGLLALAVLGFSSATACSKDDIHACEIPLGVTAKSGDEFTALTQSCESIRRTVECLENIAENCPSSMQSMINSTIAGYKQAEETCDQQAQGKEGLLLRKKRGWDDFKKKVKKVKDKVKKGFNKVSDKIKNSSKKMKENLRKNILKPGRKIVKKFGKKLLSCTTKGIITCGASLLAIARDGEIKYTSILCWKLKGAKSCLKSAAEGCRGESGIPEAVHSAQTNLDRVFNLTMCENIKPIKPSHLGSCTFDNLYECEGKMTKSPYFNKANCGGMVTAQQCLEVAKKDCNSKLMISEIEEYQAIFDEYAISCDNDGNVNGPTVFVLLAAYSMYVVVRNAF